MFKICLILIALAVAVVSGLSVAIRVLRAKNRALKNKLKTAKEAHEAMSKALQEYQRIEERQKEQEVRLNETTDNDLVDRANNLFMNDGSE